MAMVDQKEGLPTSVLIESASPHEVTLVEATLDESFIEQEPTDLLGDKGFDSNNLDDLLTKAILFQRNNRFNESIKIINKLIMNE